LFDGASSSALAPITVIVAGAFTICCSVFDAETTTVSL
jgi:hypothetical protein